ncbi:hypothetical protein MG296_10700 [Flavobacteriaceae bacterium TK19130]|nr:hypothetical protein [Thermobacterium salinum]
MQIHSESTGKVMSIGALINGGSPQKNSPKVYRYPYMDKACINQTIQNAKAFAEAFNKEQEEKSSSINAINSHLRKQTVDNPHTIEQKVLFKEYISAHKLKDATPEKYNHEVLRFNREHGTNFLMRSHSTLRNEIAITLPFLVVYFAAQLRDRNAARLNSGITTAGTLPSLRTNSYRLSRYKIDGVKQCPYTQGTLLKHIHTLEEAGIVKNFESHGRRGGFSLDISAEVLHVEDYKSRKIQNAENKRFTNYKIGETPLYGLVTRTLLKEDENKGDAKASPNKSNGTKVPNHKNDETNYKTTQSVSETGEEVKAPREKSTKSVKNRQKALKLEKSIRDEWELCNELANDQHVHHVPDIDSLENEAKNGVMSQSMFRDLLFQEFMKYVSKLKRGDQSYPGAFSKAFQELRDKKLVTFTGKLYTKQLMFERFKVWLWSVDHAERWGREKDWPFLYINDYLDTQRRDAKEMGFWYVVEKIFPQNEKKKERRSRERAKKRGEHYARKKKIKLERIEKFGYRSVKPRYRNKTDFEKARIKVRMFLRKEIGFDELYRYCQSNLNHDITKGLENLINSERIEISKFNA